MGEDKPQAYGPTAPVLHSPRPLGARHVLQVWLGDGVRSWRLPERGEVIVGRTAEVQIQIDLPAVSRQHARIEVAPSRVHLTDLGSHNGTRVNGERVAGVRALHYGDIVTFGDVTAMLAEDREGEAVALPGRTLSLGDRAVLVADPAMLHVYTQLERLGPSDLSVLILGETGTGKELAAAALRFFSRRREGPLVTINCAALPETLAESELFGYEKGAFSGAAGAKPGLLESAPGGTLLLDEVGDLSPAIQAKLLRVLETRRLTRLGSVAERPIDVRVVAATHRDLSREVEAGRFREDLYYRLSVAVVRLPPLRERKRELPLLAVKFLGDAARALGRSIALSDPALDLLRGYAFPGNVRELKNLMEYAAATASGDVVGPDELRPRLRQDAAEPIAISGPVKPLAEASREFERQSIASALAQTGGNKTRAAKLLGVPLRTLMDKIKRHGL